MEDPRFDYGPIWLEHTFTLARLIEEPRFEYGPLWLGHTFTLACLIETQDLTMGQSDSNILLHWLVW